MATVLFLVAAICAAQILDSVKQLKKYRRDTFSDAKKYNLFLFGNVLNIFSVGLIAYGAFLDNAFIWPACSLWLFNWHLYTYYAAELKKDASRNLIVIMRVITGLLTAACVFLDVYVY